VRILNDENLRLKNLTKYFQSVTRNKLVRSRAQIEKLSDILVQQTKFRIREERSSLSLAEKQITESPANLLAEETEKLNVISAQLKTSTRNKIEDQTVLLENLAKQVSILDPVNILKRGFSITMNNGKAVKSIADVKTGDKLSTLLADGRIDSTVNDLKKNEL
jgi:exodeoxyribonuclease VII large subunit